MDYASIAIVGKLNDLYKTNEVFLSFPLGKIAFSYQDLDFISSEASTGVSEIDKLNNKANFSRIVNIIPRDHFLFEMDASRFVWDEYQHVLEFANFAKSSLTIEEEKQLDEAIRFLGEREASFKLKKYQKYRARFDVVNRQYTQRKLSVELSTGSERELLIKEWDQYLEKELREAKEQAENDWINLGYRFQVEKYQAVRNSLEAKKYGNAEKYLNDLQLSEFLDINGAGASIYSTIYSPQNAFDRDIVWGEVTLTSSEIQSYVEKASEEVKNLFAGEVSTNLDDLESITLEYNNVSVIRPWFHPQFFDMRNWKLTEDNIISDGNIPRNGRLPAFISSMIVIKNVRYQYKNTPSNTDSEILSLLGDRPIINVVKEIKSNFPNIKIGGIRAPDNGFTDPPPFSDRDLVHPTSHFEGTHVLGPEGDRLTRFGGVIEQPMPRRIIDIATGGFSHISRPERFTGMMHTEEVRVENTKSKNYSFNEGIYVIAFVCKRIPKSPNPDLNLTW